MGKQVARMRQIKVYTTTKSSSERLNGKGHREDLSVDGRIILECIFG